MKLHIKNFRGTAPNTDPRLLDTNFATEAQNCSIDTGAIVPLVSSKDEEETFAEATKTLYPYQGDMLSWTTSVDVCKTPIENDLWERIYYTGDGVPKFKAIKRHEVSTAYTANTQIKWASGNTVWKCTTAGTTASTAPSITSIAIGGTCTDGTVVWTRLDESTSYPDYDTVNLKMSRPDTAPSSTGKPFSVSDFTVQMEYFYESSDGTITPGGVVSSGAFVWVGTPRNRADDAEDRGNFIGKDAIYVDEERTFISYAYYEVLNTYLDSLSVTNKYTRFKMMVYSGSTLVAEIYENTSINKADGLVNVGWITPVMSRGTFDDGDNINNTGVAADADYTYFFFNYTDVSLDVTYLFTYVDKYGRESRSGDPSTSTTYPCYRKVRVVFSDTAPAGTVYRRLYRVSSTSDSGGEYLFVADIPVATTTYYDYVANANLGDSVPSIEWYEPDDDLQGLVSLQGGFFAAFTGRSVKFSEPNYPWAWPAYDIPIDDTIVGLGVSGNNVIVLTEGPPAIITTSGPSLTSVSPIASNQSCESKDSIVMDSGVVYFASPDGYCMADGAVITNLTSPFLSKIQWNAYNPSSITAFAYDGKVYLSPNEGNTLIYSYSTKESGLLTMGIKFHAAYYEATEDTLYYVSDGKLYSLFSGTGNMEATWGKKLYSDQPTVPKMIRVYADAYPVKIRLSNTTATHEINVKSADVFRLPKMRKDREWIATYIGRSTVSEIALSSGMRGILL